MSEAHIKRTVICQGDLAVSGDRDVMLSAVLGSCIATCLWDPVARVGGMNHILLPDQGETIREDTKFGIFAMETLINEMMKIGARKSNLVAKLFGGALTFENELRIGDANVTFARDFFNLEGIPLIAESTGGGCARRIRYFPENGKAKQMFTTDPDTLAQVVQPATRGNIKPHTAKPGMAGQVEIFK